MRPDDQHPEAISAWHRRWRRLAAFGALRVAVLAALWCVLVGGFAWLGASEGGLRWLCAQLAQASDGRLQVAGVGGRLLGDWQLRSLRWSDAAQSVEVADLSVSWSPMALMRGELLFARVEAGDVHVWSPAQGETAPLPDDLNLPLALSVERLRVARVWYGQTAPSTAATDGAAWLLAEAIEARLASDGSRHRVESLRARLGPVVVTADATLEAQAPFALAGHAQLRGAARGQDFSLALEVGGTLARVRVNGRASAAGRGAAGEMQATLEPFAPASLGTVEALRVRLAAIDLQAFTEDAPQARLDVDLALERAAASAASGASGGTALSGRLRVVNRDAGSVDRQRLPLISLDSALVWHGDEVRLGGLTFALSGGGRLAGRGRVDLARQQLEVELAAHGIDARALHAALPATRLAGPLRAAGGAHGQRVDVDWRDARYAVRVRAQVDAQAVDVEQLQIGAPGAGAGAMIAAQGRLGLSGERRFAVHGRMREIDAARLLATANAAGYSPDYSAGHSVPKTLGMINAEFEARGKLQPTPEVALHFALDGSRIGAQSLAGRGDVDWSEGRLRRAEIDLLATGNRLHASGAYGRAGDTLKVALAAPRLEALGWPGLSGELHAALEIGGGGGGGGGSGALADPDVALKVEATRVRLGEWFDGARLSVDAHLAPGAQGALALGLRCATCSVPAVVAAPLTLSVDADGVRAQHRVRAHAVLPQRREVHLAGDGELAGRLFAAPGEPQTGRTAARDAGRGSGGAPGWRGSLAELRFSGPDGQVFAALASPAPLAVAAGSVSFGPASLAGRLGRVSIDRLVYEAGLWQSAGRLQQFRPQPLLAQFSALHAWSETLGAANAQPLVLAGEWDMRTAPAAGAGATPIGRAALWREQGDVALGGVALGLTQARVQASFGDGRLALAASVRGTRVGEIDGEVGWGYPASATPAQIERNSPWQGRLQASVPDLAWLGALFGEGWQVAGQVHGEMQLAGSAAHPELTGQWRGERLAVRALDLGMRLERGEAALEITPQRLYLRRLRFESALAPLPRALRVDDRADLARLTATPGVVEASGELSLDPSAASTPGSAARLGVRFERYGVVQRADQWVAVSGEGELRLGERALEIGGTLRADAAFWSLAAVDRPALSDDVVLRSKTSEPGNNRVGRALKIDLALDLGNNAYFRGAGVDSRLAGALRIRSDDAGLPRATGSIRTVGGRFDAYGQKLDIERGIVNFQGPIDNPGLNLLAVRKNLPVEAGVEVGGTAQRPLIRLVSSPAVPDAEKLSWLVLGRSPEQQGGDGALLFAAAQTIVGGQDGGVLRQLQRGLGIDEFGVSSGQVGGYATLPTSRVASTSGFGASQTVNGQIVTIGKRLASNAVLSYQQSLKTTESIVKLTVNLGHQFSVVGSAGSDSALDFFWTRSFGK